MIPAKVYSSSTGGKPLGFDDTGQGLFHHQPVASHPVLMIPTKAV